MGRIPSSGNKKPPIQRTRGFQHTDDMSEILIRRRQLQTLQRGLCRLRPWRRGRGQQIR